MTSLLKFRVLMSLLTLHVSCPSPWARQNCPASLKSEQILPHKEERSVYAKSVYPDQFNTLGSF